MRRAGKYRYHLAMKAASVQVLQIGIQKPLRASRSEAFNQMDDAHNLETNRAANSNSGSLAGMVYLASVCNQHKVAEKYRKIRIKRTTTSFRPSPPLNIAKNISPRPKIKTRIPSANSVYLIDAGMLSGK